MVNLLLVLMAIVLLAGVIMASINYMPFETRLKVEKIERIERHTDALMRGIESYQEQIRDPATGEVDFGADQSGLMNSLAPAHVFRPRLRQGSWSAGVGGYLGAQRPWIYMQPPDDGWPDYAAEAMEVAAGRLPEASAFIAGTCGATSSTTGGDRMTVWFNRGERHPGYQIMSVAEPVGGITYDAERAANVNFRVRATVENDPQGYSVTSATITAEIREPGQAWMEVDKWGLHLAHVIGEGHIEGFFQIDQYGSVQAKVPGGWEFRLTQEINGSASLAVEGGQLQFLW